MQTDAALIPMKPKNKFYKVADRDGMYFFHPGRSRRSSALCLFYGKIGSEGHSERGSATLIHPHKQGKRRPRLVDYADF
jgi:hypothetical protein